MSARRPALRVNRTFGPARQSVRRAGAALVEEVAAHRWAGALGAGVGAADLPGAEAMLDRVYRALEEPTA